MNVDLLQSLFSEDIRDFSGNTSVSVEHLDYMQTFQIPLAIFTFALNPSQGASAFFNAVSPLLVDVHGSVLAQTRSTSRVNSCGSKLFRRRAPFHFCLSLISGMYSIFAQLPSSDRLCIQLQILRSFVIVTSLSCLSSSSPGQTIN